MLCFTFYHQHQKRLHLLPENQFLSVYHLAFSSTCKKTWRWHERKFKMNLINFVWNQTFYISVNATKWPLYPRPMPYVELKGNLSISVSSLKAISIYSWAHWVVETCCLFIKSYSPKRTNVIIEVHVLQNSVNQTGTLASYTLHSKFGNGQIKTSRGSAEQLDTLSIPRWRHICHESDGVGRTRSQSLASKRECGPLHHRGRQPQAGFHRNC